MKTAFNTTITSFWCLGNKFIQEGWYDVTVMSLGFCIIIIDIENLNGSVLLWFKMIEKFVCGVVGGGK